MCVQPVERPERIGRPDFVKQSSVLRMACVNSIIIFSPVVIGLGCDGAAHPGRSTAGAACHLTVRSSGRCDPIPPRSEERESRDWRESHWSGKVSYLTTVAFFSA